MRKKEINKIISIIAWGFIIIYIFFTSLTKTYNCDDVWVFQCSNLVKQRLYPYKGFNTIVSPLFVLLTNVFLLPFNTIKGIGIVEIFLSFLFVFLVVFKINISIHNQAFVYILKFSIIIVGIFTCKFEYNYIVFIYSLIIYIFIQNKKALSLKDAVVLSALSFLCTGTKITYGIMITFACFLCILYEKNKTYKLILFLSSLSLFSLLYFSFLNQLDIWQDFVDQCIMPIINHGSSNDMAGILLLFITLFFINIALFIRLLKNFFKHELSPSIVFSYIAFGASIINILPSCNIYHMELVILHLMMFTIALINNGIDLNIKDVKNNKTIKYTILFNFIFFMTFIFLINNQQVEQSERMNTCFVKEYTSQKDIKFQNGEIIDILTEYKKNHTDSKYLIISGYSEAINYFSNNSFNKYFDLMIDGNFGSQDPIILLKNIQDYDYIIFPKTSDLSYDKLLDQRLTTYFEAKQPIDTITINDKTVYGIYNF